MSLYSLIEIRKETKKGDGERDKKENKEERMKEIKRERERGRILSFLLPFFYLFFSSFLTKLTIVIVQEYHCYQLHTKFHPLFFSQGYFHAETKLLGGGVWGLT
jgi:hypothetical protein